MALCDWFANACAKALWIRRDRRFGVAPRTPSALCILEGAFEGRFVSCCMGCVYDFVEPQCSTTTDCPQHILEAVCAACTALSRLDVPRGGGAVSMR